MKKILIILVFVIFKFTNAQEGVIVSIEQYIANPHINSGTYVKDINHTLDFYVGTWEGIWNNKKVTIILSKVDKKRDSSLDDYNYFDKIVGKYVFRDLSTNQIILDTSNLNNPFDFPVFSVNVPIDGKFDFSFKTLDPLCTLYVDFLLKKVSNNPNQLKYKFIGIGDLIAKQGCTYDSSNLHLIPVPFPRNLTTELILNKI